MRRSMLTNNDILVAILFIFAHCRCCLAAGNTFELSIGSKPLTSCDPVEDTFLYRFESIQPARVSIQGDCECQQDVLVEPKAIEYCINTRRRQLLSFTHLFGGTKVKHCSLSVLSSLGPNGTHIYELWFLQNETTTYGHFQAHVTIAQPPTWMTIRLWGVYTQCESISPPTHPKCTIVIAILASLCLLMFAATTLMLIVIKERRLISFKELFCCKKGDGDEANNNNNKQTQLERDIEMIRSRFKDDGTIQITTVNGTAPVDGIPALTLSPRKSSLKPPRQNAYPSPVDTEMNMIEENNGEDNDNNNNNSTTTTTTTNVVGGRRKSMVTFNEKTEIRVTNF